jgi:hypothetical protein
VLHLVIGLPMNRLLIPRAALHASEKAPEHAPAPAGISWTVVVLAAVFGATWCVATALAAHLPRLLQAMGVAATTAIFAASLVGPAQVAARLVEFTFLQNLSPMISARLATALHPIGAVLLVLIGPAAAIPFVLLHGAGNGMLTIARGTLPLALFGPAGYGLRTGIQTAPARRCCSASCSITAGRMPPCCSPAPLSASLSSCSSPSACRRRPTRPQRKVHSARTCIG